MADLMHSIVGSGQQPFRKEHRAAGKRHKIADMVFVTNFEDQVPTDIFTSGFALPAGSSGVRLPPRAASLPNFEGRRVLNIFNAGSAAIWVAPTSGVQTPQASPGGISIGYPIPGSGSLSMEISALQDVW